jgi:cytochrome c
MKTLIFAVMLGASTVAIADEGLAKKNNCLACHAVDKKLVGPSFKDVSAKYAGKTNSVDYLSKKIRSGGGGVWGPIPMPAQPQLSEADAKKLAEWILKR